MSITKAAKNWNKRHPEKAAEYARLFRKKYPERTKAAKDKYRQKSRDERLPREAAKARERRAADPEGALRRRKAFNERREALRVEIAGRIRPTICEICNEESDRICFDHCHTEYIFRGWICDRCNKVLGLVKDDLFLLQKLIDYLGTDRNGKIDNETKEKLTKLGLCRPKQKLSCK